MVTRRRFLSAAAAGAAMFARVPNVLAATYDLVVKGGRVIDPSLGIDTVRDGVTGYVDAGSFGADGIDQGAANVKAGPNVGRLLINIARTGVAPGGELHDLSRADVSLARGAIARHRDVVVGVKARLSNNVADTGDLEALRRAQEAA